MQGLFYIVVILTSFYCQNDQDSIEVKKVPEVKKEDSKNQSIIGNLQKFQLLIKNYQKNKDEKELLSKFSKLSCKKKLLKTVFTKLVNNCEGSKFNELYILKWNKIDQTFRIQTINNKIIEISKEIKPNLSLDKSVQLIKKLESLECFLSSMNCAKQAVYDNIFKKIEGIKNQRNSHINILKNQLDNINTSIYESSQIEKNIQTIAILKKQAFNNNTISKDDITAFINYCNKKNKDLDAQKVCSKLAEKYWDNLKKFIIKHEYSKDVFIDDFSFYGEFSLKYIKTKELSNKKDYIDILKIFDDIYTKIESDPICKKKLWCLLRERDDITKYLIDKSKIN